MSTGNRRGGKAPGAVQGPGAPFSAPGVAVRPPAGAKGEAPRGHGQQSPGRMTHAQAAAAPARPHPVPGGAPPLASPAILSQPSPYQAAPPAVPPPAFIPVAGPYSYTIQQQQQQQQPPFVSPPYMSAFDPQQMLALMQQGVIQPGVMPQATPGFQQFLPGVPQVHPAVAALPAAPLPTPIIDPVTKLPLRSFTAGSGVGVAPTAPAPAGAPAAPTPLTAAPAAPPSLSTDATANLTKIETSSEAALGMVGGKS
jgi:hypothetical protein